MPVASRIENTFRDAHEARASVVWGMSAIGTAVAAGITGMPMMAGVTLTASSAAMALLRGWQTKRLFEAKLALAGHNFWLMPPEEFLKILDKSPSKLWLGRGFRWTAKHAERALALNRLNVEEMLPPPWFLRMVGRPYDQDEVKGAPWIHGLELEEKDLFMPWSHASGNWNFFGTTGAGKTRLYEVMTYQMVRCGDTLIFLDPKNDKELERLLRWACAKAGRPEAFAKFHPAFPSESVRLDPLANFGRRTEIASRIAEIVSAGSPANDNFTAFIWRTLDAITGGLLYVDERPSLKKLRYYAESGPEPLVEKCLQKFLSGWMPSGWENHVQQIESALSASGKKMQPRLKTGTPRQQAMVQVYHDMVGEAQKLDDLNALLNVAEHSREHHSKMIAGLLPLLTQLTSGSLGDLLSPDYSDQTDKREILDMEKVTRGQRVLLIQTDSLSDSTVGSAIAAILLSDMRSDAGTRYNYDEKPDAKRIHLICDEAKEVITRPLIALMNKGRGAGLITYLATQNFPDYIDAFGSEDAARSMLGNGNNRLCLRVVDTKTQDYMVETLGEVDVRTTSTGVNSKAESEAAGMEFGTGKTTTVSDRSTALFPGSLLGQLPDLHFVAVISGGKVFKGRFPKVLHS